MARDIPFKPRFYIDHLQFIKHAGIQGPFAWGGENPWCSIEDNIVDSLGVTQSEYDDNIFNSKECKKMFDFNPTNHGSVRYSGQSSTNQPYLRISVPTGFINESQVGGEWYWGALGHNCKQGGFSVHANWAVMSEGGGILGVQGLQAGQYEEIINTSYDLESAVALNGFSLSRFKEMPSDGFEKAIAFVFDTPQAVLDTGVSLRDRCIGALTFGKIFDLSIPCDLKMNLTYEYGNKSIESRSGGYLSSSNWFQAPTWINQPCWELNNSEDDYVYDDPEHSVASGIGVHKNWRRSGRRIYDMTFTFLSSDEMLSAYGMNMGEYGTEGLFQGDSSSAVTDEQTLMDGTTQTVSNNTDEGGERVTIHNDHSFYAQVVHKTMGFHLPFIFQPNSDYARPDGFMLARVDARRGFQLQQLAPDLWRCKLKVEEIW